MSHALSFPLASSFPDPICLAVAKTKAPSDVARMLDINYTGVFNN
jgi:hypothetical protein